MSYYDKIEVSDWIDINKTSKLKECYDNFQYRYFLYKNFKFQPDIYNGCHHLLMTSVNLNKTAILNKNNINNKNVFLIKHRLLKIRRHKYATLLTILCFMFKNS